MLQNFGVPEERVAKIPAFCASPRMLTQLPKKILRRELNLPTDAFLVCGAGTIGWRKGTDYFLLLAQRVRSSLPEAKLHFVWLGDAESSLVKTQIEYEIELLNLMDMVTIAGPVTEPEKYFAAANVFALTSREDPFPLVALEAGRLGLPVVCFEGRVGSTAFVDHESGKVVPYGDVESFANAVIEFHRDPQRLRTAGDTILRRTKGYDVDNVAQMIFREIEKASG
jgi:glycosyltransferase involved in cell wall biosynthesis